MGGVVVTDYADQLAESLITPGGIPGNRTVEAPGATLPDPAVGVDQKVVGDVVPTLLRTGVEVVEAAQDPWCVRSRVTVARGGMVNDEELDILTIERAFWGAIGCPR